MEVVVSFMPDRGRDPERPRLVAEESQMTAVSPATSGADALPDYAPVPPSAFGPALNEQGYHVGRVERNLFWVTDGTSAGWATPHHR